MPRIVIDNREVDVPAGTTILDAARELGIDIPTLCFLEGYRPATSCMVCLVRVKDWDRLVPSCATVVEDGMQVESESEEIRQLRRTGLELLLSDHVGSCVAPCQLACPAGMDIPLMLRQVAAGDFAAAIATIKKDLALPGVLGRVCPELCEQACRRRAVDQPVSICLVKRFVADWDLASESPYLPGCRPSSAKNVAIIGAGPTGLSAAYHLLQFGHSCTVFDDHGEPGGKLRYELDEDRLPREVLDAEIAIIENLGARFKLGRRIGRDESLPDLQKRFDAVLIAVGTLGEHDAEQLGLPASRGRLRVDSKTFAAELPGLFAAGGCVLPSKFVVRSVGAGKAAATCVDQYLRGVEVSGSARPFTVNTGRMSDDELQTMAGSVGRAGAIPASGSRAAGFSPRGFTDVGAHPANETLPHNDGSRSGRATPQGGPGVGLTEIQARAEALRCLQCDCLERDSCKLRRYAELYGAKAATYRGERRVFSRHLDHAEIIYEPGKCILCGLCIQIASEAREPLGLAFVGRGFDVRVSVPFDHPLADGLKTAARRCAEACPTRALVLRDRAC
ncbi:MAG: (2Fe-2S)-binding protein [Planctomycetes bacterium]|nr:(2Fe-2S)-binding protein [Planctomycetota bacterium]